MFAITTFADLAILVALIVAWCTVIRLVAGDQPLDLTALLGQASTMPWPRGVQEEEPPRWRLELLDRRPPASDPREERGRAPDPAPQPAQAGCATG